MKRTYKPYLAGICLVIHSLYPGSNVVNNSANTCTGENINCEQFTINSTGQTFVWKTDDVELIGLNKITTSKKIILDFPQQSFFENGFFKRLYTFTPTNGNKSDEKIQILFVFFDPQYTKELDKSIPLSVAADLKTIKKEFANGKLGSILKVYRRFGKWMNPLAEWVEVGTFSIAATETKGFAELSDAGLLSAKTKTKDGKIIDMIIDLSRNY
ncbi:hypothetical protein IPH25_04235 [bacterium]|nr:MAG: hypothetical protein IPG37_01230 [bacterium]QQR61656.1 MAG: hypothetical protein IPH25_04235 [bacterium]QQR62778.1 MAG: hypothetical protein IPH67_05220 [bacterium]